MVLRADLNDGRDLILRVEVGRQFQQSICRHEKDARSLLEDFKGLSRCGNAERVDVSGFEKEKIVLGSIGERLFITL